MPRGLRLVCGSAALLFACAAPPPDAGWHHAAEQPQGARFEIERGIEVGGAGVRFHMPDERTRVVRLEADARDFPLGTTLWATITGDREPRNFLLSGVFGHRALVGTYPGNANWVEHDAEFAARAEVTLTLRAIEWDQTQMIGGHEPHGEPTEGNPLPGYPYNRIIKLAEPHTRVRLTVVPAGY
ncbi:MAG: hypothetical protein U1E76_27155 [Planctomycetota bacterium]